MKGLADLSKINALWIRFLNALHEIAYEPFTGSDLSIVEAVIDPFISEHVAALMQIRGALQKCDEVFEVWTNHPEQIDLTDELRHTIEAATDLFDGYDLDRSFDYGDDEAAAA